MVAAACTDGGSAPAPATALRTPSASRPAPTTPIAPGAFSGANARRHVDELAGTIGSRPAGTAQEKAAADYLTAQFERYGYQVEQQGFEFTTFEDRSALRVLRGEPAEVQAALIVRSAQGTVRGSLADGGLGLDLVPGSLQGRVALIERGQITFEAKVARATEAGASAVVVFNNRPGFFRGVMQNASTIPAVSISQEDGQRLRAALARGPVEVEVQAQGERVTRQSQNVVARRGPHCAVIVGGHYDSVPEGPGANDNASGTAVVLEAARALAPAAAERGLCFLAFGAEELGLHGSRAFVASLESDQRNFLLGMINLDMVGVGESWRLIGDPDLVRAAGAAARSVGVAATSGTLPEGAGSDHQSFLDAGIRAVFLHLTEDPLFHTPQDTPDRVDPADLEAAGTLTLALVQAMTEGP